MLRVELRLQRPGFDFDVAFEQTSAFLGVFGHSGAGKSTLIHLLAGLERPDRGVIRLDNEVLLDTTERIFVPSHQRRIGVMFQDDRLFPHYSVMGNLRYGQPKTSTPDRRFDFGAMVSLLKLDHLLHRRVHTLSGGERQRVALGRALLSSPRLLLMDEPLASLDRRLKQEILPFLQRIREHAPIPMLYVSHDLTEILQLTDELLLLDRGRAVGHGRYRALSHDPAALDSLHDRGLMNVFNVAVHHQEAGAGLTHLRLGTSLAAERGDAEPGAVLVAPHRHAPPDAIVQIAIRPEDISLAVNRVSGVSIQNQLQGKVARSTVHAERAIVEIDVGRPLLAEVSLRTIEQLNIRPGQAIWCLIKSNAIRYLSPP